MSVLDRKWREHLYEMDYLQEGIGLRAMAQRDPLVEYQREGFDMFAAMMDGVKEESVGFLFNLQVEVDEAGDVTAGPAPAPSATPLIETGPGDPDDVEEFGEGPKLDVSLLKAAQEQHESASTGNGAKPAGRAPGVQAKGLERKEQSGLTYSSPELGSDAPAVTTDDAGKPRATANSTTARRQQSRSNPNRGGGRGNKPSGSGQRKRKR